MSEFGKAFTTLKEARRYAEKQNKDSLYVYDQNVQVRKMSRKLFPRRKKLYHVGTETDFLNFA